MSYRPIFTGELLRPDLGVTMTQYFESQLNEYVFPQVLPVFNTPEKRADYPVIPISGFYKNIDTSRAERGYYPLAGFEFKLQSYSCSDFGVGVPFFPEEVNAYRRYIDAERSVSSASVDIMLRDQERKAALFMSDPNNAGNIYPVTIPWTDRANSTPLDDIVAAKRLARLMGVRPNVLVVSEYICEELLLNNSLIGHLQPTKALLVDSETDRISMLARYLNLEQIVVGKAMLNSAPENKPMELVNIWPNETAFLLYRASDTKTLRVPTYGWTFCWDGMDYNMPGVSRIEKTQNIIVESYSEPNSSSIIYRAKGSFGTGIVYPGAMIRMDNIA